MVDPPGIEARVRSAYGERTTCVSRDPGRVLASLSSWAWAARGSLPGSQPLSCAASLLKRLGERRRDSLGSRAQGLRGLEHVLRLVEYLTVDFLRGLSTNLDTRAFPPAGRRIHSGP